MSRFNPHSRTGKALIADVLLKVALEQETDPIKRERIQKILGILPKEKPKPLRKCLLPSCRSLTRHNGGYCCSDHAKEHQAELESKACQKT